MDKNPNLKTKNIGRIAAFIFFPILFAILSFFIIGALFNLVFNDAPLYENVFTYKASEPTYNIPANIGFKLSTNTSNNPLNLGDITFPHYGQTYGSIEIPSVKINCPLIYGDDPLSLSKGACQYIGSFIPGYNGTSLISGHNNRVFRYLKNVMNGDLIKISTSYGVYVFKVTNTAIISKSDPTAYDLSAKVPNLILYTCYKESVLISDVTMRYYVYASYISGPLLKN